MNSLLIRDIRSFNRDTTPLEDAVFLSAIGKIARTEFEAKGIPVPEWLDDFNRTVSTAIDNQTREAKLLRLRELNAEEERLMPASEKRERVAAAKKALEQELAGIK